MKNCSRVGKKVTTKQKLVEQLLVLKNHRWGLCCPHEPKHTSHFFRRVKILFSRSFEKMRKYFSKINFFLGLFLLADFSLILEQNQVLLDSGSKTRFFVISTID